MSKTITTDFYGDITRWFIAEVVDNANDPFKPPLGRVRIRIIGLHNAAVDAGDLPWASVMLPTTEGGVMSGFPPNLENGAQVFGIFLDGINSQMPLVLGSIPHKVVDGFIEAQTTGQGYSGNNSQQSTRTGAQFSTNPGDYGGALEPIPTSSAAAEQCYNYFTSLGPEWTDAVAKGIIGNIIVESGNFDERIVSLSSGGDLDGNSYGICQWRNSRVTGPDGLLSFAKRNGIQPGNLSTQLQFIKYELDTFAYLGKAGLFKCTTPAQAAVQFMRKFEIPAELPDSKGGGTSRFPEPPYSASSVYPRKKYGEEERIAYAEGLPYSGTYYNLGDQP